MPKRELSKCREWERERRGRLKTCFDALARLLPSHDPTVTPSKLEILQRAAAHISDLQQKNKELLLGDQRSTAVAQRDEVRRLRDRVKKLNTRSEQLVNLLKTAGLKVPKECLGRPQNGANVQSGVFKGPPRLWSGRLSREKADVLRKQHENELKTAGETAQKAQKSRKRKRLSSKTLISSENTPPPVKKPSTNTKFRKKSPKKPGGLRTSSPASLASKVATVLGPGTLILANGSVVPVPAPVGTPATLHRIQLLPAVTQTNPQVILVPQQKTNSTNNSTITTNTITTKLPVLRPKTSGNLKQNIVTTKIAIPPLPKRKICARKIKNTPKPTNSDENRPNIEVKPDKNDQKCDDEKTTTKSDVSPENTTEKQPTKTAESDSKTENNNEKPESTIEIPQKEEKPAEPEKAEKIETKPPETDPLTHEVIENDPSDPDHLNHSELSNDIFASLGGGADSAGVIGGQHTESMSPTAAFLLAFPLVSTLTGSRISDPQNGCSATGNGGNSMMNNTGSSNNNTRNEPNNSEDDRQSTPTTLLQIGGTMNLDGNKTIHLDKQQPKNVLQQIQIDSNLKQDQQPRNISNYEYYKQSDHYGNQQNTTFNSNIACLYEQRNTQHNNTNNFYPSFPEIRPTVLENPQNFNNCHPNQKEATKSSPSKHRIKQQSQRPPVNWMTTPDIRPSFPTNEHQGTATTSGMTSDYFLPPFSDVYSGISSAISNDIQQNSNNTEQNFSTWGSGTNRSVLPTLLGDLALGVTSANSASYSNTQSKTVTSNHSNQYYHHPFEPSNLPSQNSGGFLSVSSMLVGGKARKNQQQQQHNQQQQKRHREKSNKSRSVSTNNIADSTSFEGQKKYGGGYSAVELIGEPQFEPRGAPNYSEQIYHQKNQIHPQHLNQNHQQQQSTGARQNQGYQHRQQGPPQQQQGPFGASYPSHGEFSALLSAAVVDTYSKTFDSFVHVKPPTSGAPVGAAPSASFDNYCATRNENSHNVGRSESDRRRHSRRSGGPTVSRDTLAPNGANTNAAGFSELSFLSISGAVSSPILPDDFHGSGPFLTNAPPPIPTPVASSLTNFNLSAIFPEINKGAAVSSAPTAPVWPHSKPPVSTTRSQTRYQHNQQLQTNHHEHQPVHQHSTLAAGDKPHGGYCHPQQHPHGQHEGLYGGGTPSQGFPGILSHHQVQGIAPGTPGSNSNVTTAPTNFSFSFSTP